MRFFSTYLCPVLSSILITAPVLADKPQIPLPPLSEPYRLSQYPQKALERGQDGCAYVSFWVNKQGSTKDVEVIKKTKWFGRPAKRVYKRLKFKKPSEKTGVSKIGPFNGLLVYRLEIEVPQQGVKTSYKTNWQCPFESLPRDHDARMILQVDMSYINPKLADLHKFRLIKAPAIN